LKQRSREVIDENGLRGIIFSLKCKANEINQASKTDLDAAKISERLNINLQASTKTEKSLTKILADVVAKMAEIERLEAKKEEM
jgi:hypothetical protein